MTAVEILEWLYKGCFDERFAEIMQNDSSKDIYELFDNLTSQEIVDRIEAYEYTKQLETRLKVSEKYIIIGGRKEKPYYSILYKQIGCNNYTVGFSSYNLDYVRKWFDTELELVEDCGDMNH